MKELILSRLRNIEKEHDVKILYACESGSRIWGFESKDSDWDVRFIYTRPLWWYLSVNRMNNISYRDVIEYPLEKETNLDINGWDLTKALFLLYKSNCPLIEWLNTPIIYYSNDKFYKDITSMVSKMYSRVQASYHYYNMTRGNIKEYLENKDIVWTKKYIYILRTLLATMWVEKYSDPVPVRIQNLIYEFVSILTVEELIEIDKLLRKKINGEELGREPKNEILNSLIFREMDRLQKTTINNLIPDKINKESLSELNDILYKYTKRSNEDEV